MHKNIKYIAVLSIISSVHAQSNTKLNAPIERWVDNVQTIIEQFRNDPVLLELKQKKMGAQSLEMRAELQKEINTTAQKWIAQKTSTFDTYAATILKMWPKAKKLLDSCPLKSLALCDRLLQAIMVVVCMVDNKNLLTNIQPYIAEKIGASHSELPSILAMLESPIERRNEFSIQTLLR